MKLSIPTKAQNFYAPLWVPNEWVAHTLLSSMLTHCPLRLLSCVAGAGSCTHTGTRSKAGGHVSSDNNKHRAGYHLSLQFTCPHLSWPLMPYGIPVLKIRKKKKKGDGWCSSRMSLTGKPKTQKISFQVCKCLCKHFLDQHIFLCCGSEASLTRGQCHAWAMNIFKTDATYSSRPSLWLILSWLL